MPDLHCRASAVCVAGRENDGDLWVTTVHPLTPPRHRGDQLEERAFARGVDVPVDGYKLVAVDVVARGAAAAGAWARVEEAPRRVAAQCRDTVVPRRFEVEMVVLVEQDRLT